MNDQLHDSCRQESLSEKLRSFFVTIFFSTLTRILEDCMVPFVIDVCCCSPGWQLLKVKDES